MTLGELFLEMKHRSDNAPRKPGELNQQEADELLEFAHGTA